jgi:hypothetical protein
MIWVTSPLMLIGGTIHLHEAQLYYCVFGSLVLLTMLSTPRCALFGGSACTATTVLSRRFADVQPMLVSILALSSFWLHTASHLPQRGPAPSLLPAIPTQLLHFHSLCLSQLPLWSVPSAPTPPSPPGSFVQLGWLVGPDCTLLMPWDSMTILICIDAHSKPGDSEEVAGVIPGGI